MPVEFDEFAFDEARLELFRNGLRVKVDAQALRVLAVLLARANTYVSKDALITQAWGGRQLGENVVSVAVAKLRKALGEQASRYVQNAYGRGYRFSTVSPSEAPNEGPTDFSLLVGRDQALARVEQALQQASLGRGSLCAILGEAGIGKTRLAEALAQRAPLYEGNVVWGRCYEGDEASVLGPWLQIAHALGAPPPPAWTESVLPGTGSPFAWGSTVQWLSSLCREHSRERTAVFVLEDMQWADTASLTLLHRLCGELSELRLVVLATVRAADAAAFGAGATPLDRVLGHRNCERIGLTRLAEGEVARYLARALGREDARLAQAVFTKSEGNPFFMVELTRVLRHAPSADASSLTLRGPALDIIRQAIQKLPEPTRAVLSAGSVLGRSFALGVLAQVVELAPGPLLDSLEPAIGAGLLSAAPDSNTDFTFSHDLIRSSLYDALARRERAQLHLRAAACITAASDASRIAELARHRLGALPEGDAAAAIGAARRAAEAAWRVGAHADASALIERALAAMSLLDQPAPRTRAELLLFLTQAERAAGSPRFAGHLAEAAELSRLHRFGDVLANVGEIMTSGGPGTLSMPGAAEVLEAARQALPPEDTAARARVLAHLAVSQPYCRDAGQVAGLLAEAEALAGESVGARLAVLRNRVYFASGPGNEELANALTRQVEQLVVRWPVEHGVWLMAVQFDRLLRILQHGSIDEAADHVAVFGKAGRRFRHAELLWHHDRIATIMRMNRGELGYARERFAGLMREAEELGLYGRQEIFALDTAELRRYADVDAEHDAQHVRGLAARLSDPPNVYASKLRSLAHYGKLEQARAGLRAWSVAEFEALPSSRDYLATLAYFAFVSVCTEERPYADALYRLLAPHAASFAVGVSFHNFGAIALHLGRLALVRGDARQAVAHLEHALQLHSDRGLVPLATATRLELARALNTATVPSARAQRQALLSAAKRDAMRLEMTPLLLAIDAESA